MKFIDFNSLHKPIYAEDDNITGSNMTYQEMDGYNEGIDTVWNMLQNAPTIDAIPVVRGHWVKYGNHDEVKCSVCEWPGARDVYGYFREQSPYCRVCGALLDTVEDEEVIK